MSSEIKVDTISEQTSANGVAIDSVTLKDGGITTTGAVGVNESSPSSYYYNDLVVNSGDEGGITIVDTSSGQSALAFADSTSGAARYAGRVLYNHNTETMQIGAGGNTYLNIDGNGHMTNASQSACLVAKTSTQSNVANTDQITFDTERFDQNDDFASNTFTAPVTGKYLITFCVSVTGLDFDATYNRVKLVTSNRNYSFGIRGEQTWTANPNYHSFEGSLLVDMDASDTAKLEWSQAGGSSIADIFDSTNLSIVLVC